MTRLESGWLFSGLEPASAKIGEKSIKWWLAGERSDSRGFGPGLVVLNRVQRGGIVIFSGRSTERSVLGAEWGFRGVKWVLG